MTTLATRHPSVPPEEGPDPAAASVAVRLRDAASQMVAFSPTKGLLREAAALIERLDSEVRVSRAAPR
jgi:hypothetical protein